MRMGNVYSRQLTTKFYKHAALSSGLKFQVSQMKQCFP